MFLDTSGLLALMFEAEAQHEVAVAVFRQKGKRLTHSYVVAELFALGQARKYPRAPVVAFVQDLLTHPTITVIWVDEALTREGMALLEARSDKSYSLCDAVTFVPMRQGGLREALTTDHHFEQEGFGRLLP